MSTTNTSSLLGSEPKLADSVTTRLLSNNATEDQILEELRQLNRIQARIYSEPPLTSQAIWNFLLQFVGLIAAALFGIFAILAWHVANTANSLATDSNNIADTANAMAATANRLAVDANQFVTDANQIALAAYCQAQLSQDPNDATCASIVNATKSSISRLASSYFPATITPSSTPSAPVVPESPFTSSHGGVLIAGITTAVIFVSFVVGVGVWSQCLAHRRRIERSQSVRRLLEAGSAERRII